MMTELVSIVFSCTAAVHMGLIDAVLKLVGLRCNVCVKCITFWTTLLYMSMSGHGICTIIATSFLNAWIAVWLEMGMGYVDTLYRKCYEKIYSTTTDDDEDPADAGEGASGNELPDVREEEAVVAENKK